MRKYTPILFLLAFAVLLQCSFTMHIFPFWKSVINIIFTFTLILILLLSYKLPTQDLFVWLLLIIVPTVGYNINRNWNAEKIEVYEKLTDDIYILSISPSFNIFHHSRLSVVYKENILCYKAISGLPGDIISINNNKDSGIEIITATTNFFSRKVKYDTLIVPTKKLN